MKKIICVALPLVGVIMFSGCATILGGGNQQTISVNSSKPLKGEMKYSDGSGLQHFTSPATLSIERRSKDIVLTSSNGEFDSTTVKSDMNPWLLGNIIFGGVIGSTTDSVGGAAWKYQEVVNLPEK
ncbi:MAG: hypothetical protein PHO62_00025 [Sulfurimonas sp.]|uniref:hypothetical protein n=1 Tax=Sulfurimonas sp. TaxID=2022749 RepID=UPI002620C06D|nr:hypothetical protein [Sulfurimonas sp.]MDD5371794.1 hypothetical protein [Sulfurimonas sp.]